MGDRSTNPHPHAGAHAHVHAHELGDVSDARLVWVVLLNLGLTVFEVLVGVMAGSLMRIADALHNFSDGAVLMVAAARRVSRRHAELIGAIVNLTALVIVGLYLVYEAVVRLASPQGVAGTPVMLTAAVALVVDTSAVLLLGAMARGWRTSAREVYNTSERIRSRQRGKLVGAAGRVVAGWGDVVAPSCPVPHAPTAPAPVFAAKYFPRK